MFVQEAYVPDAFKPEEGGWPFCVPAIAALLRDGLTFDAPVTVLVGDNGAGKSTLMEALAEAFKINPKGGRAATRTGAPDPTKTALGEILRLRTTAEGSKMLAGPRRKKRGFFLRAETAFSMTENLGGVGGYWEDDTAAMSHGEAFLTIFEAMFQEPGFYLLDEPESALSFSASLKLVEILHRLGQQGGQFVCATHSPVLAATPGADIIELYEGGVRRSAWDELDLVKRWRGFLGNPQAYVRHMVEAR